ncbi:hypothetical protein HW555_000976, partial [Spodoptera exigua]
SSAKGGTDYLPSEICLLVANRRFWYESFLENKANSPKSHKYDSQKQSMQFFNCVEPFVKCEKSRKEGFHTFPVWNIVFRIALSEHNTLNMNGLILLTKVRNQISLKPLKDKYIYEFYTFINGLDNLCGAKKLYNRLHYFLKFFAFFHPINKMFVALSVCYNGLSALSTLWLLGLLADPFFNIFMCVLVLDLIEDDYNYIKIKLLQGYLWVKMYCSTFIARPLYVNFSVFDFIMYIIFALYTKDEYIYKFYNFTCGIDNLPGAKKIYNRLYIFLKYYIFLFYCRTKIIRMTVDIESKALTRDNNHVKKIINMYELLVNSLDIIDMPMKMMVTGSLLIVYSRATCEIYEELSYLRENGLGSWSYVFIVINMTDPVIVMMGAAIVADLISDEYNYLKTKIIEMRIRCDNERHRSELKQLQLLLQNCPLRFCVLPNIPLKFSLFLCSISDKDSGIEISARQTACFHETIKLRVYTAWGELQMCDMQPS